MFSSAFQKGVNLKNHFTDCCQLMPDFIYHTDYHIGARIISIIIVTGYSYEITKTLWWDTKHVTAYMNGQIQNSIQHFYSESQRGKHFLSCERHTEIILQQIRIHSGIQHCMQIDGGMKMKCGKVLIMQ